MKGRFKIFNAIFAFSVLLFSCSEDETINTVNLGITPVSNADAGSSYTNSKTDIYISYSDVPVAPNSGDLRDAIAYLDADGDGDTDVFMATGEFLLEGEVNCILGLNDGANNFTSSTAEFNDNMPPANHARKTIVSDFNNDGLLDLFVFDHGFDSHPFPGNNPKLIMQNSVGSFTWTKLLDQTGFHHGGAAADVDNDGDIDVFVGGFEPFFYVNDGDGNFTKTDDRFDRSIEKIFSAELIDIDKDGFVDLLVGAHERDGNQTSIYWGSSTGSYNKSLKNIIPPVQSFGAILDFDAEDIDGDNDRDLVINRTRDGDDGNGLSFYQGRYIQLVLNEGSRNLVDKTQERIDDFGSDNDQWIPWLRMQDVDDDGDIDIFPDNLSDGFKYLNDGEGNFTKK